MLTQKLDQKFYFQIGAILQIVSGITHFLFNDLLRDNFLKIENRDVVFQFMEDTQVEIFFGKMTLASAYNGYSLSLGMLMIAFGAMNLVILSTSIDMQTEGKKIILVNIIVSLILAIIATLFLFFIPILAMFFALLSFTFAYF